MALLAFLDRQADPRFILLWLYVHYLQEMSADRKLPGPSCGDDCHWGNRAWGWPPFPLERGYHWLALDHVHLKKLCSPLNTLFCTVLSYLISIAHCFVVTFGTWTWVNTTLMFISEAFKCCSVLGTYRQPDLGQLQLSSPKYVGFNSIETEVQAA